MTLTYTKDETVFGNKRIVFGKYANDGTTGTIATGLHQPEFFMVDGATAVAESAGTLTVTLAASNAGSGWMAFGSD